VSLILTEFVVCQQILSYCVVRLPCLYGRVASIMSTFWQPHLESQDINLGIVARKLENPAAAQAYYNKALAIFTELGQPQHAAEDSAGLAAVYLAMDEMAQPQEHIELVLEIAYSLLSEQASRLPDDETCRSFFW